MPQDPDGMSYAGDLFTEAGTASPEDQARGGTVTLLGDPGIDRDGVRRFLEEVFGRSTGIIETAAFLQGSRKPVCSFRRNGEQITSMRDGTVFTVDAAMLAEAIARGDDGVTLKKEDGPQPVDAWYVRMTTLAAEPVGFARGGASNIREFFGFWLDGDYAVDGHHKTDGGKAGHKDGTVVLPPDAETVQELWRQAGYPEPTATWRTGGGINGLWLLENPVTVEDGEEGRETYQTLKAASKRWHDRVRMIALQQGYHHDTTHNLDRLLRLPGSVNRKVMHHPKAVTAEYGGPRYSLDELLGYIPEPVRTEDGALIDPGTGLLLKEAPLQQVRENGGASRSAPIEGLTPWDDFDARADWWTDVLGPVGFTHQGWAGQVEHITRPGKEPRDGLSATLNHDGLDKLFIFSDTVERTHPSVKPYTREYLTKSQVLCHMAHGGDWSALAQNLRGRGYGDPLPERSTKRQTSDDARDLFAGQIDGSGQVMTGDPLAGKVTARETSAAPKAPIPLEEPPPQPYDLTRMGALGQYTQAVADNLAVPGGMVLMAQLGVVSAAVGGRRRVRVRPGWTEPVVTHSLACAPPGSRKSAAVSKAAEPLKAEERKRREKDRTQVQVDRMRRQILDDQIKAVASQAAKGTDPRARAAAEAEAEGLVLKRAAMGEPMEETRMLTSDITPEELAYLMARQGGRMAVIDSEAAFLSNISGRYSPGGRPKVDLVLNAYDQQAYTVDRVGREEPVEIDTASLTIALAVQGDAITGLGKSCQEMDRRGTWGRYLYDVTPGHVLRTVATPAIPEGAEEVHDARITKLMEVCYDSEETTVMELSEEAREAFFTYYLNSDPALRSAHHRVRIQGWEEKQPGRLIRIAALRTLYENPHANEIPGHIMRDVIAMDETMRQHAHRASAFMTLTDSDPLEPPRDVLSWLLEELPGGIVRTKDVLRAMRKRRRPWALRWEDIVGAVDVLEEYGHVHYFKRADGSMTTDQFTVSRYHVPEAVSAPQAVPQLAPQDTAQDADRTERMPEGLDEVEQYTFDTEEENRLREEVRLVNEFVIQRCRLGDIHTARVQTGALYDAYLEQRAGSGGWITPVRFGKALSRAVPAIGRKRLRADGARPQFYVGIELA